MALSPEKEGKVTESAILIALHIYKNHGLASGHKTYPETKMVKTETGAWVARLTGQGPPDWAVTLPQLGGRSALIESKTWAAKNHHKYRSRLHQYEHLMQCIESGGLGLYLVKWRHEEFGEDWRLYDAAKLNRDPTGGLEFERLAGHKCQSADGWPEFLSPIMLVAKPLPVAHASDPAERNRLMLKKIQTIAHSLSRAIPQKFDLAALDEGTP